MKLLFSLLFISLIIPSQSFAAFKCPDRSDYFCITPEMNPHSKVSAAQFTNLPLTIFSLFSKELTKTGYPLILDAQWESPYFGGGVIFYEGQFKIMLLGGTVRTQQMTLEAYAAIVCHELGHIIGGSPLQTITGAEWSSSEGQSDFFAASVCLPRYFKAMGVATDKILESVEKAGFEMVTALNIFDPSIVIKRFAKDESVATETLINNYPSYQCRYENFRNPTTRPACWFNK